MSDVRREYRVSIPYVVFVHGTVFVDCEDDAIAEALKRGASLTAFAGNGGYDKLVGVRESDLSVEACDCPLDEEDIHATAEEIKDA